SSDTLMCMEADLASSWASFWMLSDPGWDKYIAPIPSLLATAAVHHHLIPEGTRTQCGLVIETGEAREAHHFCLLIGYGAGAINPYLAFETLADLAKEKLLPRVLDTPQASNNSTKPRTSGIWNGAPNWAVQRRH